MGHVPPTFLEIAVVTLENNATQKKFSLSCPLPPPQIQFPFYGSVFRAFSGNKVVTVSKQECFGLERIGIFPIVDSLYRLPFLRLSLPLKPGFHMIVGDRSQSLGSFSSVVGTGGGGAGGMAPLFWKLLL